MKPSLIIPRLRAELATLGNRVFGAAEFAAAFEERGAVALPAAFVVPAGDEDASGPLSAPPRGSGRPAAQTWVEAFDVIVAVDNTAAERGQDAAEAMEDLKEAILAALLGYRPATGLGPIIYSGGELMTIDRAELWWSFGFAVERIRG